MTLEDFTLDELYKISLAVFHRMGDLRDFMTMYPASISQGDLEDLKDYRELHDKIMMIIKEKERINK